MEFHENGLRDGGKAMAPTGSRQGALGVEG